MIFLVKPTAYTWSCAQGWWCAQTGLCIEFDWSNRHIGFYQHMLSVRYTMISLSGLHLRTENASASAVGRPWWAYPSVSADACDMSVKETLILHLNNKHYIQHNWTPQHKTNKPLSSSFTYFNLSFRCDTVLLLTLKSRCGYAIKRWLWIYGASSHVSG